MVEDVEETGGDDLKTTDQFYFVDETIKERLSTGDGPSFSFASLFASTGLESSLTSDLTSSDSKPTPASVPSNIFTKPSLFILDANDSRFTGASEFFNVRVPEIAPKDLVKRRREISLIVQNKFKRVERNQSKQYKPSQNRFPSKRHQSKKQKT